MVGARSALVRLVVMLTDHRVQHQQQQHSTAAATSSPPATTPAAAVAASGAVAANCRSPRTHRCKHCRVRLRNVHGRGDTRYVSSEAASVRAAPAAAAVAQLLNPLLIRSGFRAERLRRQWRGRLPMACGSWTTWSHCGCCSAATTRHSCGVVLTVAVRRGGATLLALQEAAEPRRSVHVLGSTMRPYTLDALQDEATLAPSSVEVTTRRRTRPVMTHDALH